MQYLSDFIGRGVISGLGPQTGVGNRVLSGAPMICRATLDTSGNVVRFITQKKSPVGPDLVLSVDGANIGCQFRAAKVWGSVWNDTGEPVQFDTINNAITDVQDQVTNDINPKLATKFDKVGGLVSGPVQVGVTGPQLTQCTINMTTGATTGIAVSGPDLCLTSDKVVINQQFKASKIWNAVWNDFADFQKLNPKQLVQYGYAYVAGPDGLELATSRCQKGVMGISSDTFGMSVGSGLHEFDVPISVSGWVLAHVADWQNCERGDALVNLADGVLGKAKFLEKILFPERIVAIFDHHENEKTFGDTNKQVLVGDRSWVKVK